MSQPESLPEIAPQQQTEIEAAVYRKLIAHLHKHPEVQNIDLMNLAYFCRNCFAKWYQGAAAERGIALDTAQARELVYGMAYSEYQAKHGEAASAEQLQQFETARLQATE